MITKRFSELYSWLPKSNFKAGDGLEEGLFPFYTSSDTQKLYLDDAQFFGQALILGTGGNPSLHYVNSQFSVSTDCVVAVSGQEDVNIKYTYYFLRANVHLLERGFRGSGMKHISKKYIENIEIKYPSTLEEQNRIVTILDKVQYLIDKREESIQSLDNLLQSIYLEMFGIRNPAFEEWEYVSIESYKKDEKGSMRTGPFGSTLIHDTFKESGPVAVLGIDNAVNNIFRWDKKRFITKTEYQKLKNYTIYPRDVIITIMGTIGRSAVIPENIGLAINTKHLAALTLDERKCNPYYLSYSIHSNQFIQEQLKARSRGSVMSGLNLTIIKQLKLKDAPIELQNNFELQYTKIQTFKSKLLDFKLFLENLLNSLSQRVFRGQNIDIRIEVEALINSVSLKKSDENNDISNIKGDVIYLQALIDKLASRDFEDDLQYDKARYIAFRIMKENDTLIRQIFHEVSKAVKLELP